MRRRMTIRNGHRLDSSLLLIFIPLLFVLLSLIGIIQIGGGIMIFPISAIEVFKLALEGLVLGVSLATVELIFLSHLVNRPGNWILATVIGSILGWISGGYLGSYSMQLGAELLGAGGQLSSFGFALPIGLGIGIAQASVLQLSARRQLFWSASTAIGWFVGWNFQLPVIYSSKPAWWIQTIVSAALFGLIFSACTYLMIRYMPRHSSQKRIRA